jgi:phosphatidylinositol 4-kinase
LILNYNRGFKAAQKHQREILLLAEMMYSGHGTTLPCFTKGNIQKIKKQ